METQRAELKQWISMSLGRGKWEELVRMEGQIRKERQETIYKQAQRRQKFMEVVGIIIGIAMISGCLIGLIWLIYAARNGLL